MASLSPFQHQHPFFLDSLFFPPNNPLSVPDQISPKTVSSGPCSHNEANKNNTSSSTVAHHKHNKRKSQKGSSPTTSAQPKEKKQKKMKKNGDEEKKGYIHVRARRGQATDSHSLAERARRGKISERMKVLQALVPGCDKVTGKALMLDEIINYVQSLQYQTEFLSMCLASLSPKCYDFGTDMESFMVRPDDQATTGFDSYCLPGDSAESIPQQHVSFPLIYELQHLAYDRRLVSVQFNVDV